MLEICCYLSLTLLRNFVRTNKFDLLGCFSFRVFDELLGDLADVDFSLDEIQEINSREVVHEGKEIYIISDRGGLKGTADVIL